MAMQTKVLEKKLAEIKFKQARIDQAWLKTGDRKLITFFVELIPKALNVDRCSIFVHDPIEENLWLQCGTHLKEQQIRVPKWSSLVGKVIETGEYVLENEMEESVGAHDAVDVETGFVSRNCLCVPVRGVSVDKITGAIQVLNKLGNQGYTNGDRDLLEKMAFHLQSHIESLFLRQEMSKVSRQLKKQISILEGRLYRSRLGKRQGS